MTGEIWYRPGRQLGITADAWGNGLLIVSSADPGPGKPNGAAMAIPSTCNLDDTRLAGLGSRWRPWRTERFPGRPVTPMSWWPQVTGVPPIVRKNFSERAVVRRSGQVADPARSGRGAAGQLAGARTGTGTPGGLPWGGGGAPCPAAVEWLRHAGSLLASLAVQGAADAHGRDQAGRLCREAGLAGCGFTVGRWNFWRRRLEDISAAGGDAAEQARAESEYMSAWRPE
jgi:Protein of unknown function (DUF3632)